MPTIPTTSTLEVGKGERDSKNGKERGLEVAAMH